MKDHLTTLEYDKVLELLAAQTSFADAAEAARALRPAQTLEQAERLMDETDAAYQMMAQRGSPSFGQPKNMTNALRRAQAGASLNPRELLDIGELLRVIRSLSEWYVHNGGAGCLDDRFYALCPQKHLERRIEETVSPEEEIVDTASPALQDLRRKMRAASSRIRESLDKMIRSPAYQKALQEPIVTLRQGRFVLPVKVEHRQEIPGLVHDTSASGATVFVEPMSCVEANNELKVLQSKEKAEIERLLLVLSGEIGSFADHILADYDIVIELNVVFAKARLAYAMRAVRPRLTADGHLILHKARHPLIDPQKVVPITLELGGAFDTLVITGPNTGGKTVALKTIGLLTLMAMSGLIPPVSDGSSFSLFNHVLADIGDEQSIEQSLSTFSAHMTNLIDILRTADHRSLVLMDELGAGTDPVEGAALAVAILDELRAKGAVIASTTHYAELKAYAIHTPGVENGSCEFDIATLRPTYRLLVGVPGRSNAFAIAQRLGMDPSLVDRARGLVSDDDRLMEDVVASLENRRGELERELKELAAQREALAAQQQELIARAAEQEKQLAQQRQQTEKEAARLLERAKAEATGLLDELTVWRKQMTAADFRSQAGEARAQLKSKLDKLEALAHPVAPTPAGNYTLPRALRIGDEVLIRDIRQPATVLSLPDDAGMVTVMAGILRTRVPLSDLRLCEKPRVKAPTPPVKRSGESRAVRSVQTEVDLRGLAIDEALLEVDRFIDNAVMSGLGQVTIIHGKGTGALRAAVHKHLKTHPSVAAFRLGVYGEGETGVTIAELK